MSSGFSYSKIPGILVGNPAQRDEYIVQSGGKAGDSSTFAKFKFGSGGDGYSIIYPFPESLVGFIDGDSQLDTAFKEKYGDFISAFPYAQIRAYEPNTMMQFATGWLQPVFDAIEYTKNRSVGEAATDLTNEVIGAYKEVKNFLKSFKHEASVKKFIETFNTNLGDLVNVIPNENFGGVSDVTKFSVLNLPYLMYFNILGATTNAVYQVPCVFPSDAMRSDGRYGWKSQEKSLVSEVDSDSFDSGFGGEARLNLITSIASKFNITVMPMFKPDNQTGDPDGLTIEFDLINDTDVHAIANFAFVQTLTGNNKWIQSTITTRPSNLYDIRIPGNNRLMMCTGAFTVKFKGAVRTVTEEMWKGVQQPFGKDFRIPEAYSITMKFDSLIPSNFNTYIIGMVKSSENLFDYNGGVRKSGNAALSFGSAISKAAKAATEKFDTHVTNTANDILADISESGASMKFNGSTENQANEKRIFNNARQEYVMGVISNNPDADYKDTDLRKEISDGAYDFAREQVIEYRDIKNEQVRAASGDGSETENPDVNWNLSMNPVGAVNVGIGTEL